MSEKKIIAVLGATGAQGGGLARSILDDPSGQFSLRAITRNANSDNAKGLSAAGAEVVSADMDDVDSLKKAFDSGNVDLRVGGDFEDIEIDLGVRKRRSTH